MGEKETYRCESGDLSRAPVGGAGLMGCSEEWEDGHFSVTHYHALHCPVAGRTGTCALYDFPNLKRAFEGE